MIFWGEEDCCGEIPSEGLTAEILGSFKIDGLFVGEGRANPGIKLNGFREFADSAEGDWTSLWD